MHSKNKANLKKIPVESQSTALYY